MRDKEYRKRLVRFLKAVHDAGARFTVDQLIRSIYGRPITSFPRHQQRQISQKTAKILWKLAIKGYLAGKGVLWTVKKVLNENDI